MEKEEIKNIIADIMINDGPDGHCDGSDIIANFVESLLKGNEKEWIQEYFTSNKERVFSTKT